METPYTVLTKYFHISEMLERLQHILVDEFQDTNTSQYRLLSNLLGEHKNISVVGDDDQSIYNWRGANIQNILGFEKDAETFGADHWVLSSLRLVQSVPDTIIELLSEVTKNKSQQ